MFHDTTNLTSGPDVPTSRISNDHDRRPRWGASRRRRGATLIFVITIIVLFTLAGTTFLVVASQFQQSAKRAAQAAIYVQPARNFTDEALFQILRGDNRNSVTAPHSILGDKYDVLAGFKGRVQTIANQPQTGNHFMLVTMQARNPNPGHFVQLANRFDDPLAPLFTHSQTSGAYIGCELTFLDGPAAGVTTRVTGYQVTGGNPQFVIMIDRGTSNASVFPPDVAVADFVDSNVLINGRPFTGMGAAINNAGAMTNEALRPNRTSDTANNLITQYLQGGTNESYDVADFQNMFLGGLTTDAFGNLRYIPSFHRPALINYAQNGGAGTSLQDALLMPSAATNTAGPNFPSLTGDSDGNSISDLIEGPYHVDNTGDGIHDSVWLDLGFPIQVAEDGTRYKPLFASLILDMDGRLNVNAHGSSWHQDNRYPDDLIPQAVVDRNNNPFSTANFGPRGIGYGTSEISLRPVFENAALTPAQSNGLFQALLVERYGIDGFPGRRQVNPANLDPWAEVMFFDYPRLHQSTQGLTSVDLRSFASPADVHGRFAITQGLDGMPQFELTDPSGGRTNELWENAYEMDLSDKASYGPNRPNSADRPFSPDELEVLLRRYDVDAAGLPRRLAERLPADPTNGYVLTTDSWDSPTPGFVSPDPTTLVDGLTGNRLQSIVDYYRARRGVAVSAMELATVFAPEVLMGQRMDLNRPFGDGLDNNGNGIVDESSNIPAISESAGGEALTTTFASVPLDHNNNGIINTNAMPNVDAEEYLARSIFARHLYVLMMTILDENLQLDMDGNGGGNFSLDEETAYIVAQWAVNVVDFRDSDSIMTPFEFDLDPFNGWAVDGRLATDEGAQRGVVWGTERPELLITEVTAWHDRRTEDDNEYGQVGDAMNPDPTFDQRLRPIGSCFIELYNPNSTTTRAPAEFYTYAPNPTGIDLRAVNAGGSPIWRMTVMTNDDGKRRDPDHPDDANNGLRPDNNNLERSVYFVRETDVTNGTVSMPAAGLQYHLSDYVHQRLGPIAPQAYAVIGSQGTEVDAGGGVRQYWSKIGRRLDAVEGLPSDLNPDQTRAIVMVPGTSVEIRHNKNQASVTRNVMAVPVDFPHSFNVSEPTDQYAMLAGGSVFDPLQASEEGVYVPIIDQPLDAQRGGRDADLANNRTLTDWRVIHLQRLANPLAPWDAVTNPYMTVDSSSLDITAFNGVADDTDDPQDNANSAVNQNEFASFERGRHEADNNLTAAQSFKLWQVEPFRTTHDPNWVNTTDENGVARLGAGDHYFDFNLDETLGQLNRSYNSAIRNPPNPELVGFPWLVFNNRPFASHLELLQVPASRSSRLLHDFSMSSSATISPYQGEPVSNDTWGVGKSQGNSGQFGHLLNWFWTDNNPANAPGFARLLEYVHVPTRYVGHETFLNDTYFSQNTPQTALRHPPFNRIASYREPGRVNINTISDIRVWSGVMGYVNAASQGYADADHVAATWPELVESRRGYPGSNAIWQLNNAFPTFFANPFRGAGHGQLAPIASMRRDDVEATLLRSVESVGGGAPTTPLLTRSPMVANIQPFEDGRRSSYFATDSLQRLGNLVTTRSNVFAVWITVGYFEVTDAGLPDRELGSDTGQVRRNRAFYMIDRSRSAAFEPGSNHNVEKMILLRRQIE